MANTMELLDALEHYIRSGEASDLLCLIEPAWYMLPREGKLLIELNKTAGETLKIHRGSMDNLPFEVVNRSDGTSMVKLPLARSPFYLHAPEDDGIGVLRSNEANYCRVTIPYESIVYLDIE